MLLGQQLWEQAWPIKGRERLHFLQCSNNVNCTVRYYLSKKLRPWVDKKKEDARKYTIDRAERVWAFYYDTKCICCSCQGTRIFLQYSFFGNNLGVRKHIYFKIKVCMYHVLSRFSRVQLFATLWRPPGSSIPEILQARILEWVAISHSRGSSGRRDWARISYDPCTTADCNSIWISKIRQERKFHSWAGRWLWPWP